MLVKCPSRFLSSKYTQALPHSDSQFLRTLEFLAGQLGFATSFGVVDTQAPDSFYKPDTSGEVFQETFLLTIPVYTDKSIQIEFDPG